MKRLTPQATPTPDKPGSRATSIAHHHSSRRESFGVELAAHGRINLVPTVDFNYPDEGDEPAPRVRDDWRTAPLLKKCSKQRFASVPSGDAMTMPLLGKRLEVLGSALREAVEQMDFTLIHQLAVKAIATCERINQEELAASTPGLHERREDIVIVDDAEAGRVRIQFSERPEARERRLIRMAGFFSGGDGVTYWRRRAFRNGENFALNRARWLVERMCADRAKLAKAEAAEFAREMKRPIAG